MALNTRVVELERRLEDQRINFNNYVSVHNKGIRKHIKLVKTEMARDAKYLNSAKSMITDENNKQVLTSLIEPDARSRKKALKGPKPMKYMDADLDGNPVKERPPSITGTARSWLEISSSDDDSESEP